MGNRIILKLACLKSLDGLPTFDKTDRTENLQYYYLLSAAIFFGF